MLPVYDKPIIQYAIEEAVASGIDDILIITGRNKRLIEDYLDRSYELDQTLQNAGKDRVLREIRKLTNLSDVCYVRQKNQKGLGDAILCAENTLEMNLLQFCLGYNHQIENTLHKTAKGCF